MFFFLKSKYLKRNSFNVVGTRSIIKSPCSCDLNASSSISSKYFVSPGNNCVPKYFISLRSLKLLKIIK